MLKSLVCTKLCFSLIVLAPPGFSGDDAVVLEVGKAYSLINKGEKDGIRRGQILCVKRQTTKSRLCVTKVRVIAARSHRAAVQTIAEESNITLRVGDKLYLASESIESTKFPRAPSRLTAGPSRSQTADDQPAVENSQLARLRPGSWVEAKGPVREARQEIAAKEIEEIQMTSSLDATKMEITGTTTSQLALSDTSLKVLNHLLRVTESTRFEDADRNQVARFRIDQNLWVKVKVRIKENNTLFARVVRRIEPRDRFKIFGRVTEITPGRNRITIGAVDLALSPGANFDFLKDRPNGSPLDTFLEDEQKGALFSIRPSRDVLLGGQVSSGGRADNERDLRREKKRDKQIFSGELKLDLLWRFKGGSFAFAEGTFGIREELRNQIHEQTTYPNRLSQAYLYWVISSHLSLQVGRQDFDGKREWVYDEALDGIRLHVRYQALKLELSSSVGRRFLERENDNQDFLYLMGVLRTHLNRDHFLSAYMIQRTDRFADNFRHRVFGVRSHSWPSKGLRHWLELAGTTGRVGATPIKGYAFDIGVSHIFDHPKKPTITAAVAFATGADNVDDQNGAFRQTGLQDNNARFGGVTSFRYYGEVVDPELSNRIITTLAIGARPLTNLSADLLFHTYHQQKVSEDLGGTRLKADPNGESKYLGWGLDFVLGYRFKNRLNLEFVLGRFEPGPAFDEKDQDPAHLAEFKVRMKF